MLIQPTRHKCRPRSALQTWPVVCAALLPPRPASVVPRLSKVQLSAETKSFIRESTANYGKVRGSGGCAHLAPHPTHVLTLPPAYPATPPHPLPHGPLVVACEEVPPTYACLHICPVTAPIPRLFLLRHTHCTPFNTRR